MLAVLDEPPMLETRSLVALLGRYGASAVDWEDDTENVEPCAQDPRLRGPRCVGCERVVVGKVGPRESHEDHAWWCSEREG